MKILWNMLFSACLGSACTFAFASDTADLLAALGQQSTFEMSDGTHIVIQPKVNSVRVRFDGRGSVVLYAAGSGRFVSENGRIFIEFEMNQPHSVTAVKLSMPQR